MAVSSDADAIAWDGLVHPEEAHQEQLVAHNELVTLGSDVS